MESNGGRFIEARGARIHYEQCGAGERNVLLLHGWGCSTELMRPLAQGLAEEMRVTSVDFAGHGKSGRPPVPWGAPEFAEMVAEVIEKLDIRGCDVVGHSHGGRIALVLSAARPELVRKLVLTGASGLHAVKTEAQKRKQAAYKRLRGFCDILDALRIFGKLPERMRAALRKKYGSRDYNALDEEMRKTFVKLVGFDVDTVLPDVKAPTLLIWGSGDEETPLWMGKRMEERIPDAGLAVLPGSHYVYLERSREFLTIAKHFFIGGSE